MVGVGAGVDVLARVFAREDSIGGLMFETSIGHVAFVPRASGGTWEYWTRCGEVWRADVTAPVMPDGYRSGRWYGTDRYATRENIRTAAANGSRFPSVDARRAREEAIETDPIDISPSPGPVPGYTEIPTGTSDDWTEHIT